MTSEELFEAMCSVKNSKMGPNTPKQIVDAMLNLVPLGFWKDSSVKVLECNTKSRVFLDACFERFRANLPVTDDYIWDNMLYAGCINGAVKLVVHYNASRIKNVGVWDDYMKLSDMKFDLVVGNPPYAFVKENTEGKYTSEGYSSFVQKAYELTSHYLCMIIPARWYSRGGGKNLDAFRKFMLDVARVSEFHDVIRGDIFGDIAYVAGGFCYFLADKNYGEHEVDFWYHYRDSSKRKARRPLRVMHDDIMLRDENKASVIAAVETVDGKCNEGYVGFDTLVSVTSPYGFHSDAFYKSRSGYVWEDFSDEPIEGAYRCLGIGITERGTKSRCIKWYPGELDFVPWNKNRHPPTGYRVFMPWALYEKNDRFCIESVVAKPGDICTLTFLSVGGFESTYETAFNVASYMKTKFFRYLLTVYKQDQHAVRDAYQAIPIQDFSICWTDEMLYKRYNLSQHLIDVIESSIMTDTSPVRCDLTEVSGVSKS